MSKKVFGKQFSGFPLAGKPIFNGGIFLGGKQSRKESIFPPAFPLRREKK